MHKGDLFSFYLCSHIKAKHFGGGGPFKLHSKERHQIVLTCRIIYKPLNDVPEGAKVLIHARISLNLRVCALHCRAFKCIFFIFMTVVCDYYQTLYHFRRAFQRALASTIAAELCALDIFTTLSPFRRKGNLARDART